MGLLIYFLSLILIIAIVNALMCLDKGNLFGFYVSVVLSILDLILIIYLDKKSNKKKVVITATSIRQESFHGKKEQELESKFFDYNDYLKSSEWKQLREEALSSARYRCQKCGMNAQSVHHLKYPSRFEDDSLDNLIAVCNNCHQIIHSELDIPKF